MLSPRGFPGGSDGKASAHNAGDLGLVPGSGGTPGEGNGNPLPYSWPGKFHGLRCLVGYSPWGRRESDTTARLHWAIAIVEEKEAEEKQRAGFLPLLHMASSPPLASPPLFSSSLFSFSSPLLNVLSFSLQPK